MDAFPEAIVSLIPVTEFSRQQMKQIGALGSLKSATQSITELTAKFGCVNEHGNYRYCSSNAPGETRRKIRDGKALWKINEPKTRQHKYVG